MSTLSTMLSEREIVIYAVWLENEAVEAGMAAACATLGERMADLGKIRGVTLLDVFAANNSIIELNEAMFGEFDAADFWKVS